MKIEWQLERKFYLGVAVLGVITMFVSFFLPKTRDQVAASESVTGAVLEKDPETLQGNWIVLYFKGHKKPFLVKGEHAAVKLMKTGETYDIVYDPSSMYIHSVRQGGQALIGSSKAEPQKGLGLDFLWPLGVLLTVLGYVYWQQRSRPKISPLLVIVGAGVILAVAFMRF